MYSPVSKLFTGCVLLIHLCNGRSINKLNIRLSDLPRQAPNFAYGSIKGYGDQPKYDAQVVESTTSFATPKSTTKSRFVFPKPGDKYDEFFYDGPSPGDESDSTDDLPPIMTTKKARIIVEKTETDKEGRVITRKPLPAWHPVITDEYGNRLTKPPWHP